MDIQLVLLLLATLLLALDALKHYPAPYSYQLPKQRRRALRKRHARRR